MTPERARDEFQRQLDAAVPDTVLVLEAPLERPGPVTIRQRLTLDGRGCTIWGREGPVVRVQAANVTLKNLRIEYTADDPEGGVALLTDAGGLTLENVVVRGAVVGLKAEEGEWRYPPQLHLGTLAPRMAHTLKVRVAVPVPCQLSCNVSGLRLEPASLTPGMHEVRFHLDEMMPETLVYGTLAIQTAFLRREITVNGRVRAPADGLSPPISERDRVIWTPADWDRLFVEGLRVSSAPQSVPISLTPATDKSVASADDVVELTPEPAPPTPKKPSTKEPLTKEKGTAKKPAPVVVAPPPSPPVIVVPPAPVAPPSAVPIVPRPTGLTTVKGPIINPGVFGSPPVSPVAPPPAPVAPAGPKLGTAFGPPPAPPVPVPAPAVDEPVPPDVIAEAEKKPPSSVRMKPKSGIFGPPPAPPVPPTAPEPPAAEVPPPKKKFKLPPWMMPPPTPPGGS